MPKIDSFRIRSSNISKERSEHHANTNYDTVLIQCQNGRNKVSKNNLFYKETMLHI